MRGTVGFRLPKVFRVLAQNPSLIRDDGTFDIPGVWEKLVEAKAYSKKTNFIDALPSIEMYVNLYVDLKNEWLNQQSKNT